MNDLKNNGKPAIHEITKDKIQILKIVKIIAIVFLVMLLGFVFLLSFSMPAYFR